MGAYRTSPLQALCVISNNPPIKLKLIEQSELSDRARGQIADSKKETQARMLRNWQLEWDAAPTARFTHNLLPSIEERQTLTHLQDIDHGVVQLLKGHGPYKSYLMRFHRSDTDRCEDCGELDNAVHPLLNCSAHEDLRYEIHSKAIVAGETPWNINFITIKEQNNF